MNKKTKGIGRQRKGIGKERRSKVLEKEKSKRGGLVKLTEG